MIPFTQYLRPNGRKARTAIDRPSEVEKKAQDLIDSGAVFEIEELMSGIVSMTCERETNDEHEVLAHELCSNGTEVPETVDRLVGRAHLHLGM